MLSGNVASILGIFLTTTFGTMLFDTPVVLLNAVQILWFNVMRDTLLSVALGIEPVNSSIMKEKPSEKSESFFGNGLGKKIISNGGMIGLLAFSAYTIRAFMSVNPEESLSHANTMAFITLSFEQSLHAFNLKSKTESEFKNILSNKTLVLVFCLNAIL